MRIIIGIRQDASCTGQYYSYKLKISNITIKKTQYSGWLKWASRSFVRVSGAAKASSFTTHTTYFITITILSALLLLLFY